MELELGMTILYRFKNEQKEYTKGKVIQFNSIGNLVRIRQSSDYLKHNWYDPCEIDWYEYKEGE